MVTAHPGVIFVAVVLGFGTVFPAAATPLYVPVITAADGVFIGGVDTGKQVTIDPLIELQSSNDVGRFSNDLHRNSGQNDSALQSLHFEQSQVLTGLIVSNVYHQLPQLSSTRPLVQFARLNLYDSNGRNLLSAVIKGSSHGIAYIDFGSSIADISTITLSGNGGLPGGGPMGMVSSVFVDVPEPAAMTLLCVGLLALAMGLRRTPQPMRHNI